MLTRLIARFARLWVIELVEEPAEATTFGIFPKRWIGERSFAWLGRNRRLSNDYEVLPGTSEAWIHVAMIHLMLKRLRSVALVFECPKNDPAC